MGLRELFEHVGIDIEGKQITVDGVPIEEVVEVQQEQKKREEQFTERWPEHVKMRKIADKSQVIGEFLDWLEGEKRGVRLAFLDGDRYHAWPYNTQELLAEFFDVDLRKIDVEKKEMLEVLQKPIFDDPVGDPQVKR